MADAPFLIGQNVKALLTLNKKKLTVFLQNGSVKPNKTEWADDVCGETRSRLGHVNNFYDCTFSVWVTDTGPINAFLDYEDIIDSGVTPQDMQFGILISPPSGSKQSYVARDLDLGVWELPFSNRANRVIVPIPVRAKYFGKAATF